MFNGIKISIEKRLKKNRLAVAVSGGADSMFLLHICAAVSKDITALHVNHDTRPECVSEAEFVRAECVKLGLRFAELRAEGLSLDMPSFEDRARRERYRLLSEYAAENSISCILTAHNQDDVIETVFLKIFRGSLNVFIPQERELAAGVELWRPILGVSKKEIKSYLGETGSEYREDPSNSDPRYLRNYLRTAVLPMLRYKVENFNKKILSLSKQRAEEEDFLASYTEKLKNRIFDEGVCSIEDFKNEHPAVQKRLIQLIITEASGHSVSGKNLAEIVESIQKPHTKYIVLWQDENRLLVKENGFIKFIFKNQEKNLDKKRFILHNNKICVYDDIDVKISDGIKYRSDDIIYIRAPRPGDKIAWNNGAKKVSRLLIDKKIPYSERGGVKIVVKNNAVIGVISRFFSYIIISERIERCGIRILIRSQPEVE